MAVDFLYFDILLKLICIFAVSLAVLAYSYSMDEVNGKGMSQSSGRQDEKHVFFLLLLIGSHKSSASW